MKVLHIIESFNGQATETWLYQALRALNESGTPPDWAFYSVLGSQGRMDELVIEQGGKIIYSPVPLKSKARFFTALRRAMKDGGYDILHCHHDVLSAVYLLASAGLPFKKRIVHVHNTSLSLPVASPFKSSLIHWPMRRLCLSMADKIVGISVEALQSFIGAGKTAAERDVVMHCGIDTAPFRREPRNREKFLESIGLRAGSKMLLFAGRMTEYKNPLFVIDVLKILVQLDQDFCAVFAGSGPMEGAVLDKAKQAGLEGRVRLLGWQEDLASLMQVCDLLIAPVLESPREGLGLVVVEAQAAGLPVLMSLSLPDEVVVDPSLVEALPLSAGAAVWAQRALTLSGRSRKDRSSALAKVRASSFDIAASAANILSLYEK